MTIALNKNAMDGSSIYPIRPEPEPVKPDPEERRAEIENEVVQGVVLGIVFCVIVFLIVLLIAWIIRCKRKRDMQELIASLDVTRDELADKYGRRSTE